MAKQIEHSADAFVVIGDTGRAAATDGESPLRRLNYFDGKFLRAEHLRIEQTYMRTLVALSNQAGGAGIVHGYDVSLASGDRLNVGGGLAIDPQGRVLLLPQTAEVSIAALLEAARPTISVKTPFKSLGKLTKAEFADCDLGKATPAFPAQRPTNLWLIVISHAERLCGNEDVYGKLCEQACISDSARPFWIEGIAIRARPLTLQLPLATSKYFTQQRNHYLRSLVASAYFRDEAARVQSQISGDGLLEGPWCQGADAASGFDVPIAVLARRGASTVFLDAWTARRERMVAPPRRYWAWTMAMRPWDVFLAHVLQFQCHLMSLLRTRTVKGIDIDPCRDERRAILEAARTLKSLKMQLFKQNAIESKKVFAEYKATGGTGAIGPAEMQLLDPQILGRQIERVIELDARLTRSRGRKYDIRRGILLSGGMVEVPSAGYLPVDPKSDISVQTQVERYFGRGVDLRFCVARADYVPHALEQAQHMERISLVAGLEKPDAKPRVDIIIPDGLIEKRELEKLHGFEVDFFTEPQKQLMAGTSLPGNLAIATKEAVSEGSRRGAFINTNIDRELIGNRIDLNAELIATTNQKTGGLAALELSSIVRLLMLTLGRTGQIGGAGRGAPADTGAAAFYFAGVAVAATAAPINRMMLSFLRQSADVKAGTISFDDTVRRAMRTFAKEDTDTKTEATGTRAATLAPALPEADAPELIQPDVTIEQPATGTTEVARPCMWSSLSTTSDPLTLQRGGTADIAARFLLGASAADKVSAFEIALNAKYTVSEPAGTGAARSAKGRLTGQLGIIITQAGGYSIRMPRNIDVDDVTVSATTSSTNSEHVIRIPIKEGALRIATVQPSTNYDAVTTLEIETAAVTMPLAQVALNASQAVFQADNERHIVAEKAILTLDSIIAEPGFRARETENLFPAAPPDDVLREIRAIRDWVFFHRRREKDCGERPLPPVVVEPPPPKVTTRTFVVYMPRNEVSLPQLVEVLKRGNQQEIATLELAEAGQLTFEAANIRTPQSQFHQQWSAVNPGKSLLSGVIGTLGSATADGADVEMQRLENAAKFTDPVSVVAPTARFTSVPGLSMLARSTDGMIVLLTDLGPTDTVTHQVYQIGKYSKALEQEIASDGVLANTPNSKWQVSNPHFLRTLEFTEHQPHAAALNEIAAVTGVEQVTLLCRFADGDARQFEAEQVAQKVGAPLVRIDVPDDKSMLDAQAIIILAHDIVDN